MWRGVLTGGKVCSLPSKAVGSESLIVFCHALGFCKEVWRPVLEDLSDKLSGLGKSVDFLAVDFQGHGSRQMGRIYDWDQCLVSDVMDSISNTCHDGSYQRVIGVGHSLGGAGLCLSELQNPGTFSKLLLFEPIVLPRGYDDRLFEKFGDHPLAIGALRRRNSWVDVAECKRYFLSKKAFASWDTRALDAFIQTGVVQDTEESPSGLKLACDPKVEAEMYRHGESGAYERLSNIRCPVTIAVGGESNHIDTEEASTYEIYVEMLGQFPDGNAGEIVVMPGSGHFFPMELPTQTAELVLEALALTSRSQSPATAKSKL